MSIDTSVNPYFDDFNDLNNYKKILFKSGKSVQTRELNQLQTVIDDNITKSLSANYKNGDIIIPGGFYYNIYDVVILNATSPSGNAIESTTDWTSIVGQTLTGVTSGTVGVVYAKISKTDSEINASTLYVEYISSGTSSKFIPSEVLSISGGNASFAVVNDISYQGIIAGINKGTYFLSGYPVEVPNSQIVCSQLTASPNIRVGLLVTESIVTVNNDESLYDNALGSKNYKAPGADRIKINVSLTSLVPTKNIDNFVELFRFDNGIPTDNFSKKSFETPTLLADNNYRQFGNYLTDGIDYQIKETLNNFDNTGTYYGNTIDSNGTTIKTVDGVGNEINGNDYYTVEFSKIKANINGKEVRTLGKSYVNVEKSQDFKSIENQILDFEYGNYFQIYTDSYDAYVQSNSLRGNIANIYAFDYPNTILAQCTMIGLLGDRLYYTNLIYYHTLTFDIVTSALPIGWVDNVQLFNQNGEKAIINSITATTSTVATVVIRTNNITNFKVGDTLSTNVNTTTKVITSIQVSNLRDARWIVASDFRAYLAFDFVNLFGNGFLVGQEDNGDLFLTSPDGQFDTELNLTTPLYVNSKYYIVDITKPITPTKVFIKYLNFDTTITSVQYTPAVVLNYSSVTNILSTTGTDGLDTYTFEYKKSGATYINNFVAYICDDVNGTVNGVLPSDPGYAAAVATLPGNLTTFNPLSGDKIFAIFTQVDTLNADYLNVVRELNVPAGSFLAFYIYPNGDTNYRYSIPTANLTCPGASFNYISGRFTTPTIPPVPVVADNPYSYYFSWEDQSCGGDLSYGNFNIQISLSLLDQLKTEIGRQLSAQKIVSSGSNYYIKPNTFLNIANTPLKNVTNLDLYQTLQSSLTGITGTTATLTISSDYTLDSNLKIWMYCEKGEQTFDYTVSGNTIDFTNISPLSITGIIQIFTSVLKNIPTIKDKTTNNFKFVKVNQFLDSASLPIYGTSYTDKEISLTTSDAFKIHTIHSATDNALTSTELFDSITLADSSGVVSGDILNYENYFAQVLYKDISNPNILYVKYRNNLVIPAGLSGTLTVLNKPTVITKAFTTTTNGFYYDVTDHFELIKNDSFDYYQISYLRRKNNSPIPSGYLIVCFDYFSVNDVNNDYITVNSYDSNIKFNELPLNYDKSSYTDVIDFRYYRNLYPSYVTLGTAGNLEDPLIETTNIFDNLKFWSTGTNNYEFIQPNLSYFPTPVSQISLDYQYYLNNLAKLFFTYQGQIQSLKSASAETITENIENSIQLLNLNIPPYGRNVADISITEQFVKLYKQSDITVIETKVNNLIKETSLSEFEAVIFGTQFNLNNKILLKSAFLADSFIDTSKINEQESDISIDSAKKELLPSIHTDSTNLLLGTTNNTTITNSTFASIAYSTATQYSTIYASKTITPTIFNLTKWIGHVDVYPKVIGNYDNFGIFDFNENNSLRFIKSQIFSVSLSGLKPNTNLYSFVDTASIDIYVIPKNLPVTSSSLFNIGEVVSMYNTGTSLYATVVSVSSSHIVLNNFKTSLTSNDLTNPPILNSSFTVLGLVSGTVGTASLTSTRLVTDSSGFCDGVILIPERTFTTSDTNLVFLDTTTISSSTTSAQTDLILRDEYDIYLNEINDAKKFYLYKNITESLAQSFSCSLTSGMFLSSVDLFFFTKDTTLPFGIEIRPIENGVPSEFTILNSTIYLTAPEISTSSNGLTSTRFTFKNLIYLKEGVEYCIVFKSKSNNYSLWQGSLDESDINTGFNIDFSPNIGGLYTTKLNETWVYDGSTRFKLNLNRAVFDTANTGTIQLVNTETNLQRLTVNPISMTASSAIVKIYQKNHGLTKSTSYIDKVSISGVVSETSNKTLSTNLTAAQVTGSPSSLTVSSGTGIHTIIGGNPVSASNFGYIKIDDEIIAYSDVSGVTLTIPVNGRGRNGTTIATHSIGAIVKIYNLNGIPLIDINKNVSVDTIIDNDNYTILALNQATSTLSLGGSNINTSRNIKFDKFIPQIQSKILENTTLNYTFTGVTGNSVSDTEESYESINKALTNKSLNQLNDNLLITSNVNSVENLASATYSFSTNLSLTTRLDNISPIVDITNSFINTYSNRLNSSDEINYVDLFTRDEINDGSYFNSYVTFNEIVSDYDSTNVKVIFDARLDKDSRVGVFVRLNDIFSEYEIINTAYQLMIPVKYIKSNKLENFEFILSDLPTFRKFEVKLVIASKKQYATPFIKNFAAISFI